jgi:hypothetical protein
MRVAKSDAERAAITAKQKQFREMAARRRGELPLTRLVNVNEVVKCALEETKGTMLGEPELQDDGTWNVEITEPAYEVLMEKHVARDAERRSAS